MSIGTGPSRIVEYDLEFRPLRAYVGLNKPSDITPLSDGSLLVADEGNQEVLAFHPSTGEVLWRRKFSTGVWRARPRPGGGVVVASADRVFLMNAALEVEQELPVKGVRAAMELPNGHVLTVSNEEQGWLTERRRDGSIRWRSKPRARLDPTGRWTEESSDETFVSIVALDVRSDGTIFTSDYDAHTLRLLSKDYRVLRFWNLYGFGHYFDTRFGSSGELVVVSPEAHSVWIEWPNGRTRSWTSPGPSLPVCANVTARGTILVGFEWRPEGQRLSATLQRSTRRTPRPFHQTLPGAILLGASCALFVSGLVRLPDLRAAMRSRPPHQADDAVTRDVPVETPSSRPGPLRWVGGRAAAIAAGLAVLAVSAYAAWRTARGSDGGVAPGRMLEFGLACVAGGVALRVLNALVGSSASFSSFSLDSSVEPRPRRDGKRTLALTVLALVGLIVCLLAVLFRPGHSALAVGAWAAAQILLLAAAFDRPAHAPPSPAGGAGARALLGLLLAGTILTRFWDLGHYPDFFHWDHGIYGSAALRVLRGDSSPFFVMDPNSSSVSRPWVAVCSVLLGVFGAHYWVLRLTGAISGVLLVLGTYLLGSALFTRRAGLFAAFLVSINHVLLLYSRQPYVLDPAPFFVFALYCAVLGLRKGSRFHWCLAGVLSGWMLLTYWASTALVAVGVGILGAFLLFYPRWMWRHRAGLLWMILGAAIVYLPMLPHMVSSRNLTARLRDTTAVLNPDGSIQRDPDFWKDQMRQTFGVVLQHGGHSAWDVSTGRPICIGPETALFGMGLTYLIVSGRWGPVLVLLPWIGFGFAIGNGLFTDPLHLYHCLAAIPPIPLTSALAVDRMLAVVDRWRPRLLRLVPKTLVVLLLGSLALMHFRAARHVVGRPPSTDRAGRPVLRADARSIVPRYIREHPDYRYYLVRTSTEITSAEASFIFFADDSDVSDITGQLEEVLPVPPTGHPGDAAFIVLPGRSKEAGFIRKVYPAARRVELLSYASPEPISIYLVDAKSVRRAFEVGVSNRAPMWIPSVNRSPSAPDRGDPG